MSIVVTRFAPSPTGFLHIGGIRTAIVNYLFSLQSKKINKDSKFLLRIEDTDKDRFKEEYVESIINGLSWLKIKWDDEIYIQSNNINNHLKYAKNLLKNGNAFKCICTKEELEIKRKNNIKEGLSIKRLCSTCEKDKKIQSQEKNYCIRIKIPNNNHTEIVDEIQGLIKVDNNEIDNYILVRNDGTPTYMLSVVVDDYLMGVTHVIRGDDHLNNAFRQYHLYKNLNWKIPKFAHIPLIHGDDGKKLSKRHGSSDINEFKIHGYFPDAITNYLMKLGIITNEIEIFNIDSILNNFNLKSISKSPSRFDYDKLNSINSLYLNNTNNEDLINILKKEFNLEIDKNDLNIITRAIEILKKRSKTISELKNNLLPYINYKIENANKFPDSTIKLIKELENLLKEEEWSNKNIENIINNFVINKKINFVNLGKPLRLILIGSNKGPSIIDIFLILGKKITLNRINDFLNIF